VCRCTVGVCCSAASARPAAAPHRCVNSGPRSHVLEAASHPPLPHRTHAPRNTQHQRPKRISRCVSGGPPPATRPAPATAAPSGPRPSSPAASRAACGCGTTTATRRMSVRTTCSRRTRPWGLGRSRGTTWWASLWRCRTPARWTPARGSGWCTAWSCPRPAW